MRITSNNQPLNYNFFEDFILKMLEFTKWLKLHKLACKKNVEPTIEVSNSNPFDVLNSVDNDVEFVPISIMESDSEVEVVFDETANLRISTSGKDGSDKGYGTNSLLEQWRDSYPNNDDYDPYKDDMYENHDLSEHLQSICDDLDITVRGRKKK
ncbi:hypothetical protein Tco_1535324 [Tanacetum coccineum]